jgi:hypothetical protein
MLANEIFNTDILNIELVKTTQEQNGSSFFYAIQYAYKTFRVFTEDEKVKYIESIRGQLSDKIHLENWFEMNNGTIAFLKIIETIKNILNQNIKEIFTDELFCQQFQTNKDIFELLFTLVDNNSIEKQIIPLWDLECSKLELCNISMIKHLKETWFKIFYNKIQTAIDAIENQLDSSVSKMESEKKHKVITKLALLSNYIFDYITQKSLELFKNDIKDYNKWLPLNILTHIYSFNDIQANLLIIDYETKKLYEGIKLLYKKEDYDNNLPFIILLYINECHYECLGRKLIIHHKVSINRLFTKEDPLVITLLTYFDN